MMNVQCSFVGGLGAKHTGSKYALHGVDGRGRQDQTLHSIMQQIKGIAGTSTAQRSARLQSLARQALQAAAQSDQPTALQLLKLADYACPASETELKQEIQHVMSRCSIALHAGKLGESLATNGSQTRQLKSGAGQQAAPDRSINEDPEAPTAASSSDAAHEEQYGAAAANEHFLTATSMIKRYFITYGRGIKVCLSKMVSSTLKDLCAEYAGTC